MLGEKFTRVCAAIFFYFLYKQQRINFHLINQSTKLSGKKIVFIKCLFKLLGPVFQIKSPQINGNKNQTKKIVIIRINCSLFIFLHVSNNFTNPLNM